MDFFDLKDFFSRAEISVLLVLSLEGLISSSEKFISIVKTDIFILGSLKLTQNYFFKTFISKL